MSKKKTKKNDHFASGHKPFFFFFLSSGPSWQTYTTSVRQTEWESGEWRRLKTCRTWSRTESPTYRWGRRHLLVQQLAPTHANTPRQENHTLARVCIFFHPGIFDDITPVCVCVWCHLIRNCLIKGVVTSCSNGSLFPGLLLTHLKNAWKKINTFLKRIQSVLLTCFLLTFHFQKFNIIPNQNL